MNTEITVVQTLSFNDKGELVATTSCGKEGGKTHEIIFNDSYPFLVDSDTVKKLLAERNERTFLPVTNYMSVVTSNPDVSKLTKETQEAFDEHRKNCQKEFEEQEKKYKELVDSKEKHVQSAEKRITELEEENKNLQNACEAANKKYVELEKEKQECEEKLDNAKESNEKQFHEINELTRQNSELWSTIASYNALPFWKRLFMKVKANFDFVKE